MRNVAEYPNEGVPPTRYLVFSRISEGVANLRGGKFMASPTSCELTLSSPFKMATMSLPVSVIMQMFLTKSVSRAFAAAAASLTEWQDWSKCRCWHLIAYFFMSSLSFCS